MENTKLTVPDEIRSRIRVDPLSKNMNPKHNKGRREARAKALTELHANDEHARYVDAAEYEREAFAAVVIEASTGATRTAASIRSNEAQRAEELAITLHIADGECHTMLTDSRTAVRNYTKGRICEEAARVLRGVKFHEERKVRIKWFPAHAGKCASAARNHNETAHATARAITNHAPTTDRPAWFVVKDCMTNYSEITKTHRLVRTVLPPPHPRLSRAEAFTKTTSARTNKVYSNPIQFMHTTPGCKGITPLPHMWRND